jgi:hypothetical protein
LRGIEDFSFKIFTYVDPPSTSGFPTQGLNLTHKR